MLAQDLGYATPMYLDTLPQDLINELSQFLPLIDTYYISACFPRFRKRPYDEFRDERSCGTCIRTWQGTHDYELCRKCKIERGIPVDSFLLTDIHACIIGQRLVTFLELAPLLWCAGYQREYRLLLALKGLDWPIPTTWCPAGFTEYCMVVERGDLQAYNRLGPPDLREDVMDVLLGHAFNEDSPLLDALLSVATHVPIELSAQLAQRQSVL